LKLYNKACLGGTFELLHKGHKKLLDVAFYVADKVIIGVTSDEFVKKLNKKHRIRSYDVRVGNILEYLKERGAVHRATIVKLNNPYGPSIEDPEIEAIVVSEETLHRAFEIYRIREKKGLPPISIIMVKMVLAEDGKPITTTRILKGEITRDGKVIKKR